LCLVPFVFFSIPLLFSFNSIKYKWSAWFNWIKRRKEKWNRRRRKGIVLFGLFHCNFSISFYICSNRSLFITLNYNGTEWMKCKREFNGMKTSERLDQNIKWNCVLYSFNSRSLLSLLIKWIKDTAHSSFFLSGYEKERKRQMKWKEGNGMEWKHASFPFILSFFTFFPSRDLSVWCVSLSCWLNSCFTVFHYN